MFTIERILGMYVPYMEELQISDLAFSEVRSKSHPPSRIFFEAKIEILNVNSWF